MGRGGRADRGGPPKTPPHPGQGGRARGRERSRAGEGKAAPHLGRAERQLRERPHRSFVSPPGEGSDSGLLRGHNPASQEVPTTLPSATKDEGFVAAE